MRPSPSPIPAPSMMLGDISGQRLRGGPDCVGRWLTDLKGYAYVSPPSPSEKPTIVEDVPISIVPRRRSSQRRSRGRSWPCLVTRASAPERWSGRWRARGRSSSFATATRC